MGGGTAMLAFRLVTLVAAGVLSAACFGKLSVVVSNDVQPALILPGGAIAQEVRIEADGAFAGLIRQWLAQATAAPNSQGWDVRDNSDGSTLRLRMSRTVAIGSSQLENGANSGAMQGGSVDIAVTDYVVARRFIATVSVPAFSTAATTTTTCSFGDSLGQLALAGVTFDESLTMPGFITSTNGLPSDGGRVIWHLKIDSTSSQSLRAESIYLDWPRIAVAVVALLLVITSIVLRRRA